MINRIIEAKKYQKLALRALLPESAGEHIEVIENELSAIVKECFQDLILQEAEKMAREKYKSTDSTNSETANGKKKSETEKTAGHVKKVVID